MEDAVYVTGYSGRFPSGLSEAAFWNDMCEGRYSCNSCQDSCGDADVTFLGKPLGQGTHSLVLLQVVYEAICDASYCREDLVGTNTGVFMSMSSSTSNLSCSHGNRAEQIANIFGFCGPSIVVESGSLVALSLALESVREGRLSRALVVDGSLDTSCEERPLGAVLLLESYSSAPSGGLLQLLGSATGTCTSSGVEEDTSLVGLLESACLESDIDPRQVVYVESQHDFFATEECDDGEELGMTPREIELSAIDQVYGFSRSVHGPALPPGTLDRDTLVACVTPPSHPGDDVTATMRLRQEKEFHFSSKATSLASGATWTLPLPVNASCASIRYQFGSEDGDMIFAMYWVTETAKRVIVPQRLFDFQHDVTRGEFEVRGPGTLFLRWANTHTWFGEKVLSYEVDILEVEHPVLPNPQQRRIDDCTKALRDMIPAAKRGHENLCSVNSFIETFNGSDSLSLLREEQARVRSRLSNKKAVWSSLKALKRQASSRVHYTEDRRLALGLRTLNSYQLSEVLSFLSPARVLSVCVYWRDVVQWDKKFKPPISDYQDSLTEKWTEGDVMVAVSVEEELNAITGSYVRHEMDMVTPVEGVVRGKIGSDCGGGGESQFGPFVDSMSSVSGGLLCVVKAICMFSEQTVPIHAPKHAPSHASSGVLPLRPFLSGRLRSPISTQPLPQSPFSSAVIALNKISTGGTTVHVLCGAGNLTASSPSCPTTRYVCGATQEAIEQYIQREQLSGCVWRKHLRQSAALEAFPWRGIVQHSSDGDGLVESTSCVPVNVLSPESSAKRVAFVFAGHGSDWQVSALALWRKSDRFREVLVEGCVGLPVDVQKLFSMQDLSWLQLQMPDFGVSLVQVGVTVLLKEAGICPDVLVGLGVGEVACGFADGCTTAEEAIRIAFARSQLGQSLELGGLMLRVELDLDRAVDFIGSYASCVIACHTSPTQVVFSGCKEEILQAEEALTNLSVRSHLLSTGEIAYHSSKHSAHMAAIESVFKEALKDTPSCPRSSKWRSTSCPSCLLRSSQCPPCPCRYPTVGYEVNNICNVVDFASVLPDLLSPDMFVFEVGTSTLASLFEGGSSVYQPCAGGADSAIVGLADQLWLHGASLSFPRKPCRTPLHDRLHIFWNTPASPKLDHPSPLPSPRSTVFGVDVPADNHSSAVQNPLRVRTRSIFPAPHGFSVKMSSVGDLKSLQWRESVEEPNCEVKYSCTRVAQIEENGCMLGREYSGVRDDGVAVVGLHSGCLATHIRTGALVWPLPRHISLQDAATLPLDYCAAYMSLDRVGLQNGHAVLIDDISSSVGQAVYHVCRNRHCPVWAVCAAGDREWMHEQLGIALDRIFNMGCYSLLKKSIIDSTGGGVDVLVHVSGRQVGPEEVSLVRTFGHVCAIERRRKCTEEVLRPEPLGARRNISMHMIDPLVLLDDSLPPSTFVKRLQFLLAEGLFAGEVVAPITPCEVYDNVHSALVESARANESEGVGYDQQKILVRMSDETRLCATGDKDAEKICRVFRTTGTHVVTGGCNESTRVLATFLLLQGATRVCFLCEETQGKKDVLGSSFGSLLQDSRVSCVYCDLSQKTSCRQALISLGPSVVGLWHVDLSPCDSSVDLHHTLEVLDSCTRPLASLRIFTVLSECRDEAGDVIAKYTWVSEALCLERRSAGLPAVVVQGARGGVALCLDHLGDIVCSEEAVVCVSHDCSAEGGSL